MTNAYCTLSDVKASLSGDVPNMSSARDQSLVDKILEVSRDIDRKVALCRGDSDQLFSFLADQLYGQQIVYISATPPPTSGTFRLAFRGELTSDLDYNSDASTIQALFEALTTVGSGNATVTGFPGGPYTIDFAGSLTGPQPKITGRATFDVTDAAVVVLPTIQGVLEMPSERQFRTAPNLYGNLIPIDDCVEISEVRMYADGTSGATSLATQYYDNYPLRGLPIEALKVTTTSPLWPEWPGKIGVVARWGHRLTIPEDVTETAIIEVIRSHFAGQAGNDDRLGMTPFGTVITSKAFTQKYMALVEAYGKKLW